MKAIKYSLTNMPGVPINLWKKLFMYINPQAYYESNVFEALHA